MDGGRCGRVDMPLWIGGAGGWPFSDQMMGNIGSQLLNYVFFLYLEILILAFVPLASAWTDRAGCPAGTFTSKQSEVLGRKSPHTGPTCGRYEPVR